MPDLALRTYSRFSRWLKWVTEGNTTPYHWYETDYFGGL